MCEIQETLVINYKINTLYTMKINLQICHARVRGCKCGITHKLFKLKGDNEYGISSKRNERCKTNK